jgi:hypothetical protein
VFPLYYYYYIYTYIHIHHTFYNKIKMPLGELIYENKGSQRLKSFNY